MTNQKNKSFILHLDSLVILEKLSKEQAGELFNAIYKYQKTGQIIKLDFALDLAFTPFLNQFLRDDEKYKITCERRKEAGSKGGKQKVANASKSKQKVANVADSDSKSDSKSDSDSDSDSKNNIKEISSLRSDTKKNFQKPFLKDVIEYCQERKNFVNAEKWFAYYEANGWKVGKNPMKDWKAAVRTWENNEKQSSTTFNSDKWNKY